MSKSAFSICENKGADQLRANRAFVFATLIVQSLYFLNPKFQGSSHLLLLYSPVCVGPGPTPKEGFLVSQLNRKTQHQEEKETLPNRKWKDLLMGGQVLFLRDLLFFASPNDCLDSK